MPQWDLPSECEEVLDGFLLIWTHGTLAKSGDLHFPNTSPATARTPVACSRQPDCSLVGILHQLLQKVDTVIEDALGAVVALGALVWVTEKSRTGPGWD